MLLRSEKSPLRVCSLSGVQLAQITQSIPHIAPHQVVRENTSSRPERELCHMAFGDDRIP